MRSHCACTRRTLPSQPLKVMPSSSPSLPWSSESSRFETSVISAKNGLVYIDAAFVLLFGLDGAINRVVGTGVDVTVRRKAENELRQSEARIAEAQRLARLGSWEWNVARNQVTWSEELFRIYALDPARHVPSYE